MTRNSYVGQIREKRAKSFLEGCYKWKLQKTTIALDKYHSIDFIGEDIRGNKVLVQVKGKSWLDKDAEPKALEYAQANNIDLWYVYIGHEYNSKIYLKKKYEAVK